jgi:hypothetical protein
MTFTLSPALSCVAAGLAFAGLDNGAAVAAGVAGAGVVAAGLFSLPLFVFSVLDSQAVKASANNATARILIVMIVLRKYASKRSDVQFRRRMMKRGETLHRNLESDGKMDKRGLTQIDADKGKQVTGP